MKKLLAALLCLALLCLPCFAVGSGSATGVVIDKLDARCEFRHDSACAVTWELTITFSEGVTEFDLPLPSNARDVSVRGMSYSVHRGSEALLVTLEPSGQAGQHTLSIEYLLPETTAGTRTGQRCTLRLLAPGRACPITAFSAEIVFPREFDAEPEFTSGYYGELIEEYMSRSVEGGVIRLRSMEELRDHETLTLALSLPTGYFDLRFLPGRTATVDTILFWMLLLGAAGYWFLRLRNHFFLPRAQAMPPLSGNAGDVPYLLTGEKPDLALMVMHWASLGYLTIARTKRGKLYLKRQMDMGSERKGYEAQIFRRIFDRTDLCSAHSEEFCSVRRLAPQIAKGAWERRLFSQKGGRPLILRLLGVAAGAVLCLRSLDLSVAAQSWRWLLILPLSALGALACWLLQPLVLCPLRRSGGRGAFLALLSLIYLIVILSRAGFGMLGFLCLLMQLLIGAALLLGGRRTKQGYRLAVEYFGLRRHYRSVRPDALAELLEDDPQYFYRTISYAEALHVSDRLVKKLAGVRLESCTWLTSETAKPRSAAGFLQLYRLVLSELREQPDSPLRNVVTNLRRKTRR